MEEALDRLTEQTRVALAVGFIRDYDEATLASQTELSEIPAPPFEEDLRAARMAQLMAEAGLDDVHRDAVGNVIGHRPGSDGNVPVVIAAHLDTVFPIGTDVTVTREGNLVRGPGIADDARGLASLLTLARALDTSAIQTVHPLRFVATVGEEGIGDLRGVKHLFGVDGAGLDAAGFISLDGAGLDRVIVNGLGSRRFRVTGRGPGGHSWVDWGRPNPIHALADVARRLSELALPTDPQATLTIARWGGGTSINAIPQEAWIELDTRCTSNAELERLESRVREVVATSATAHPELDLVTTVIGARPGGATDPDEPLVRAAIAATRSQGRNPVLTVSSTDANIPMSLGIPAITLGCGGEAGQAHTTDEWYRNVHGPAGIIRALFTVLLTAGIAD